MALRLVSDPFARMRMRLPYPLLCTAVGLVVGWFPVLFHGPIREKFDIFYLDGGLAVWAWYCSRLLIGFLVGISAWPRLWYVRGPLIGVLVMIPPGFFSLATPGCGFT
jgi:hypothetical protein